jgi:hypothetical protein
MHQQKLRQQDEQHYQSMKIKSAELRAKLKSQNGPSADGKSYGPTYTDSQIDDIVGDLDPEFETPSMKPDEPPEWQQLPHPKTPAEAKQLPKGTHFVSPHGHLLQVP